MTAKIDGLVSLKFSFDNVIFFTLSIVNIFNTVLSI